MITRLYESLNEIEGLFSFFHVKTFTITVDSSKYDVMEMYVDVDDDVCVSCIGYHSFRVYHFKLNELKTKKKKKIFEMFSDETKRGAYFAINEIVNKLEKAGV